MNVTGFSPNTFTDCTLSGQFLPFSPEKLTLRRSLPGFQVMTCRVTVVTSSSPPPGVFRSHPGRGCADVLRPAPEDLFQRVPWNQRSSGLSLSPVLWVVRSSPLDADRRLQEDGRFPGAHLMVGAAFQRRGRRRGLSSITSSTSPCPCPWNDVEGGVETDVRVDRGRARRHAYHLMMLS